MFSCCLIERKYTCSTWSGWLYVEICASYFFSTVLHIHNNWNTVAVSAVWISLSGVSRFQSSFKSQNACSYFEDIYEGNSLLLVSSSIVKNIRVITPNVFSMARDQLHTKGWSPGDQTIFTKISAHDRCCRHPDAL